jgi:hypothetical protein
MENIIAVKPVLMDIKMVNGVVPTVAVIASCFALRV